MKVWKWIAGVFVVYVGIVVAFETWLGTAQPDFADSGIPMLILTTTDASGDVNERRLARLETDGKIYVSAHHWPRSWYRRAVNNPQVQAEIEGVTSDFTAVPISGDEYDRVVEVFPIPLPVFALMGFPPRQIIRLDPN